MPDLESARLIVGYFDNLAAGMDRAEALRQLQLDVIRWHRADGAAQRFFWAVFTLTGNPGRTSRDSLPGESTSAPVPAPAGPRRCPTSDGQADG